MGMDFMGWGGDGSKLHGDGVGMGINLMEMGWEGGKFCGDGADTYYPVIV